MQEVEQRMVQLPRDAVGLKARHWTEMGEKFGNVQALVVEFSLSSTLGLLPMLLPILSHPIMKSQQALTLVGVGKTTGVSFALAVTRVVIFRRRFLLFGGSRTTRDAL